MYKWQTEDRQTEKTEDRQTEKTADKQETKKGSDRTIKADIEDRADRTYRKDRAQILRTEQTEHADSGQTVN